MQLKIGQVECKSLAESNGGRQGRGSPPGVQILSFSCSFQQKKLQNNPNLGVGATP